MIKNQRFLLACLLVLLTSSFAFAGSAEVRLKDGKITEYLYQGDNLRVNVDGQPGNYLIMRDDTVYVVSDAGGQPMVMDISQAMRMFGAAAGAATPAVIGGEVITLDATGREESHAGIAGEVYTLRYRTGDGDERATEMVLSKDPRTLAFRDAMFSFAAVMARNLGDQQSDAGMYAALQEQGKGVLRYGDELTVVSLDMAAVDQARFALPAPPIDLSNMGALSNLLGGMVDETMATQGQDAAAQQAPVSGGALGNALRGLLEP